MTSISRNAWPEDHTTLVPRYSSPHNPSLPDSGEVYRVGTALLDSCHVSATECGVASLCKLYITRLNVVLLIGIIIISACRDIITCHHVLITCLHVRTGAWISCFVSCFRAYYSYWQSFWTCWKRWSISGKFMQKTISVIEMVKITPISYITKLDYYLALCNLSRTTNLVPYKTSYRVLSKTSNMVPYYKRERLLQKNYGQCWESKACSEICSSPLLVAAICRPLLTSLLAAGVAADFTDHEI